MYENMIAIYVVPKFINGINNIKEFFIFYSIIYLYERQIIVDVIDCIGIPFFLLDQY